LLAKFLEQLDPVHLRHLQVGHDDVRRELGGHSQSSHAVRRRSHSEPFVLQEGLENGACALLVVDHEDPTLRLSFRDRDHVSPCRARAFLVPERLTLRRARREAGISLLHAG